MNFRRHADVRTQYGERTCLIKGKVSDRSPLPPRVRPAQMTLIFAFP